MSLGHHAVIRELLSTRCLYVPSAHVDYLQALGFPAAKASSGCLTNPSSEHCHTVKPSLCRIPCYTSFPLPQETTYFRYLSNSTDPWEKSKTVLRGQIRIT